ncbi:MAG TPA: response regulator [Desulfobulbus sp.]|nr:response regulator [Desulfobulbus sp.]
MAIITIFSADFCKEQEVVKELTSRTNFRLTTTDQIVAEAAVLAGMDEAKVRRALTLKTSVFEKFTHEKQYALAHIKLVLSKLLMVSAGRDLILTGYSSQLIPREITHFFRVGLIADKQFRVKVAMEERGLSAREAEKLITRLDEERVQWLSKYCGIQDAFNPADYDLLIPMNKESVRDAAELIISYLDKDILQPTPSSEQAVEDFNLQAMVEVALAKKGHDLTVQAVNGKVKIIINKNVTRLNRLKEEIRAIVEQVDGVEEVEIGLSKDFHQTDVYRKYNMEMPSKVLLVDDEQEFVKTLSERLALRDMGSAVVHDGESALSLIEHDQPDVMVLDLKMPGVDGIEVLKRVKETSPEVEVIILTGHGSEEDRKKCMELGAFAYLRKPVDITRLSSVIKEAHEKARQREQG